MSVAVALDFSPRLYSAHTGRFLQQDPDPGVSSIPKTVYNKYVYSANSSLKYRDSTGMNIFEDILGYIGLLIRSTIDVIEGILTLDIAKILGGFAMIIEFALGPVNLIKNGRLPKLTGFFGVPAIENSLLSESLGVPCFSLGPSMFLTHNSNEEELLNTKKHEYGHYLQYKEWGGGTYISRGWKEKGQCTFLEMDADRRAGSIFSDFEFNYGGCL